MKRSEYLKLWGKALNGGLSVFGVVVMGIVSLNRLNASIESKAPPSDSELALIFFIITAGLGLGILRGLLSIGSSPGGWRAFSLIIGLLPISAFLLLVAIWFQPVTPPWTLWVGFALPVIGSLVEDLLASISLSAENAPLK